METFLDESAFIKVKAKEVYYIDTEIEEAMRNSYKDNNKRPYFNKNEELFENFL